jgi:DNA-binding PadR family transcriptional regulator
MTEKYLSRPEEFVLLAVWKLQPDAYGVSIRQFVQGITGKYWSIGAIYVPLERLEKKGFLTSTNTEPSAERGGRRKRVFQITDEGKKQLDELYRVSEIIWKDYTKAAAEVKK